MCDYALGDFLCLGLGSSQPVLAPGYENARPILGGGMQSESVRELKILQEENTSLKKRVAELSLDKVILQDIATKSRAVRVEARSSRLHHRPLRIEAGAGLPADQASA